MKRSCVVALVVLLGVGVAFCGCASKTGKGQGHIELDGGKKGDDPNIAPNLNPAEWSYHEAPTPPIVGSPDYRLVSFNFERDAVALDGEAVGAIREALKKLDDKPEAKLAVIGFADGIREKDGAHELGLRRAEAAAGFISRTGIAEDRIQVTSFGATLSDAQDFETIKQSLERKVEVWVLK